MVRTPLIAAVAACAGTGAQVPVAPLPDPAATPPAAALWDQGTFVVVDGDRIAPDSEERFEIFRTDAGYRFAVRWKRPVPTGEPAEGEITLETDDHFSPLAGDDVMTLHAAGGAEVTRSSLRRHPDGRLTTEVVAADGSKTTHESTRRNDWFIGSQFTTFLTALCQADPALTNPLIYPDKDTTLSPPEPLPIEGTAREVTVRRLVYALSQREVIAACEDGKLAGEVARGVAIVRTGDLALARVLSDRFR